MAACIIPMSALAYASADKMASAKPTEVQKFGERPLDANFNPKLFIAGSILSRIRLSKCVIICI